MYSCCSRALSVWTDCKYFPYLVHPIFRNSVFLQKTQIYLINNLLGMQMHVFIKHPKTIHNIYQGNRVWYWVFSLNTIIQKYWPWNLNVWVFRRWFCTVWSDQWLSLDQSLWWSHNNHSQAIYTNQWTVKGTKGCQSFPSWNLL